MYISIKLKDIGDTKLFLQPDGDLKETGSYILILDESDIPNPYLRLSLENNKFVIKHQRDLDEDEEELQAKLDELALAVIAAIQNGDDLSDTNLSAQLKPYNPDKIRVESKTFSLRQIFDMIKSKDLNLHPDFQRNLVWDNFRKSRLIESILLRIPLPMFYFSQDEEGVLSVVDGLQRLSAIYEFMSNKLVLRDLEYLDNCNDKTYSGTNNKLDDKYVRWFNMTQIVVNVIDAQSPSKVKYDIFRRINTGGRPLNAQELRNCLAGNGLREILKKMVKLKSFNDATGGSVKDTRMLAQELALRFIYFSKLTEGGVEGIKMYSGNIDEELDELVDTIGKTSKEDLEEYVALFDRAMKNAFRLFGRHAFRRVALGVTPSSGRSVINKALFASESVLLSRYKTETVSKISPYLMLDVFAGAMDNDRQYSYFLSYGTNGRQNIIYAFTKADELFNSNLK